MEIKSKYNLNQKVSFDINGKTVTDTIVGIEVSIGKTLDASLNKRWFKRRTPTRMYPEIMYYFKKNWHIFKLENEVKPIKKK